MTCNALHGTAPFSEYGDGGRRFDRSPLFKITVWLCSVMVTLVLAGCAQPEVSEEVAGEPEPPSTELDEKAILDAAEEAVDEIKPTTEMDEHLLEYFTCDLEDTVEVEGDHAVLRVLVSNVDLPQAIGDAYEELGQNPETRASLGKLYSEDETTEQLGKDLTEVIYRHISECDKMVDTTVELHFTKKGNTWKLEDESAKEFARAAYAGLE